MRVEKPRNEGAVPARTHFGGEGLRVSIMSRLDAKEEMALSRGVGRRQGLLGSGRHRWSSPVLDGASLIGLLLSIAAIAGLFELAPRCEGTQLDNCKAVSNHDSAVGAVHLPQESQAATKEQ